MTDTPPKPDGQPTVNLKDPILAAILAWLVPGLGHLYQGRLAKAVLYFVCIMGTFVYGLYLGSSEELGWGRVVYASWRPNDRRLYYLCQIGAGVPAMPAIVQAIRVHRGNDPLGHFMAPPRLPGESHGDSVLLDDILRQMPRRFELGTIYTAIAGLLNLLAVLDAGFGPLFPATAAKKPDGADEPPPEDKDG
ncbi:MAG: hypothetical protein JW809_15315 [Pirellulales bacterium]|nr:hypothetical protein [Pirellulales bacterium]